MNNLYIFNQLQYAQKLNKKNTIVNNTKINRIISSLLYKEGYIKGYTILNEKKINIFLKYVNLHPVIYSVKKISTCHKKHYINFKKLNQLYKNQPNTNLIILTNRGILTVKQALSLKIGGLLLYKIV